ncbi:MAG TPA: MFS transporter [Nocardioides sp.]|uniref:MFS transporter n=1 Tax=uncultured Nocardioides sp. TaxID=198441 RepID=UPI00261854E5|nr:MFS transporter [uncultured Nocardioides sp.]HRD59747.1 MFS transporter [Nocardioides sp.]HRK46547.1 MFS transporter [Nocardioides sp.]
MTTADELSPAELARITPAEQYRLYRRALVVVVVCQLFGGAGLAAGVTVGALLAQDMLGGDGVAGLPAALFTLGSALTAFTVGQIAQRAGRRTGLVAGFFAGAVGAAGIVIAAVLDNPPLLFVALFVYGAGTATNLQARYAGTDLAPATSRGTAVSVALVATTFGAVAGPNSVGVLGELASSLGIPVLAGPFLLASLAFAVAGLVLFVFLRPDPLILARRLAELRSSSAPADDRDGQHAAAAYVDPNESPVGSGRGVAVGATIMVLTQIAMVAIMTMTPVHMRHHHHSLDEIGFVIGMHIGAMFLPSLITGPLVDRLGRIPMAIAAAVTLLAAGLVAAFAPGTSMTQLTLALVLLGLGWNFGLISGTALIVDATTLQNRAKTQGSVDVLIALSGAGGAALSGIVVGVSSYATLALAGGFLALALLPVVVWYQLPRATPAESEPAPTA